TDRVPAVVPDLAVEVLSESNTRAEMARKREEYFRAGVQLVWEVDPDVRTVTIYSAPNSFAGLDESQTLDGGTVLPGFTLPIRRWFERASRGGGLSPEKPPAEGDQGNDPGDRHGAKHADDLAHEHLLVPGELELRHEAPVGVVETGPPVGFFARRPVATARDQDRQREDPRVSGAVESHRISSVAHVVVGAGAVTASIFA